MKFRTTAILGAGGWGTALAVLWAQKGHQVVLWGHNAERAGRLRTTRVNETYLPGVEIPPSVEVTSEIARCRDADLIVFVTPSLAIQQVAEQLQAVKPNRAAPLLSCTKGIEHGTGKRMSEIISRVLPQHQVAVLSGPNLAIEVARGLPTATVLGCGDAACAEELQQHLGTERFRIYTSDETIGIELGGALKNVFAIAAGATDGLGLGDNSKAALVTRALAELLRLGTALGGNPRTFYGLSGAGDLIATCFSQHSRNRCFGEHIGRGKTVEEIKAATRSVAEGVPTAKSAYECARSAGVETPIIDQVYAMLYEGQRPERALYELLRRDLKAERL
ncbi:MAG: NAD(P)H-dependent glycerol-3-phosphate dehydrogenase [Chthoniobacterales bacterium]